MAGAWQADAWAVNAWASGAWAEGLDIPANLTAATAIGIPALPYQTSQNVHSTDTSLTYTVWYRLPRTNGTVTITWGLVAAVYQPTLSVLSNNGNTVVSGLLNRPPTVVSFRAKKNATYWLRFTPNAGQPTPAVLSFVVQGGR